jgi:hypothetical protein
MQQTNTIGAADSKDPAFSQEDTRKIAWE